MESARPDPHLADPHLADQPLDLALWLAGQRVRSASRVRLDACEIATPLGPMVAVGDGDSLHLLEFSDRKALPDELAELGKTAAITLGQNVVLDQIARELSAYYAGESTRFSVKLSPGGTPFQRRVWQGLLAIPFGARQSYGAFAGSLGLPQSVRAVGAANGRNRLAVVIPCHRLTAQDGALTGYGGGLWRKHRLLQLEAGLVGDQTGESA